MLERTAASLESCSLQRLLSRSGRSPRQRCRQLHTGFWQHGASAFEIASLWPLPIRPAVDPPSAADPPSRPLQSGLVASAFLLDFLYPSGTRALLCRLNPMLWRPRDGGSSGPTARKRCFTSSRVAAEPYTPKPLRDDVGKAGEQGEGEGSTVQADVSTDSSALADLLSRPDEGRHLDVWDLYRSLDASQQASLRRPVALYLSSSDGIVEVGRASSLFHQIPIESWDDETQTAAVLTMMRSNNADIAINWFKTGLEKLGLTGGLEYVVANAIANQQWPALLNVWSDYSAVHGAGDTAAATTESRLLHLGKIPDLGKLYLSFERYIEQEGSGPVRAMNLYSNSKRNLRTLRWKMAEECLKQDCDPKIAAVIMDLWNDQKLCEQYMLCMLDQRARGLEPRGGLAILSNLYKRYRTSHKVKPPVSLLRGMLQLHCPVNLAGMELIYRDWHRAWGDLDQWAYEKYLRFYSHTGDAATVRYLWARYVARYPDVLKDPSAFRSTMTVYAHTGDAVRAEQELRGMMNKYGVMPDIEIWNTLLKCHSRTGDDASALQCLEEIRRIASPNSSTYAHLMAMAAKRGDLRSVLGYFDQAQSENVVLSPAMALALVSAYCHNDRLVAAEKICREVSGRKSAGTAAWNQLLFANGAQGNLDKFYDLLQAMKTFGLDWDHKTYQALLQALVKVNQIHTAFHLLRSAYHDNLFPVGTDHFEVVLAGVVRSGETDLLPGILSLMRQGNLPVTFNAQVTLLEVAAKNAPTSERTRNMARELIELLRSLIPPANSTHSHEGLRHGTPPPHVVGDRVKLKTQTQAIDRAVMVLMKLRQYRIAEELVSVYAELFPEYKGGLFPPKVAGALMLGCLQDDKVSKTIAMWHQTLETAVARYKHPSDGAVFPVHWYELCRPMNVVTKAYKQVEDGPGLVKCVERVVSADFKLTRSNWNLIVRCLSEMGQWESAMDWCEKMLMPDWRGWNTHAGNGRERRSMRNSRLLKASSNTVFTLQKEWLNMRKLAAWSGEVSQKLKVVEQDHPRLFHGFITNHFKYLPAAWVVRESTSMNQAIREMLRPMSFKELRAISKALVYQLRIAPTKRMIRSVMSPFHKATGIHHEMVLTKAFTYQELKLLEVELRNRMRDMAQPGPRRGDPAYDQGPAFGPKPEAGGPPTGPAFGPKPDADGSPPEPGEDEDEDEP
ncbi:pentatricopeptide repeat containing protein [Ophiocordyceps sinensis CO18]|uniref:Pentatricopeptide repeat containing protein n=1 Tax=Ophiocordyceps sinensis (strain Co18 / CGMCC 3.14243) TaxID=911162 RepID=T5AHA5_OPHSC|nr:pentatricopeptide repeat containing protein [Ophiocordyceps sinensis CO18]